MAICAACDQLRHQSADAAPHSALKPLMGASGLAFVEINGTDRPDALYLCRDCNATMIRGAMDDDSNPIWDLYAG